MYCVIRHQKSIDAYRAEVSCIRRLRQENVTLRQLVTSQQQTISTLSASCQQLQREKFLIGLMNFFSILHETFRLVSVWDEILTCH